VLDAADAARIPRSRPGRAFARTGHGELIEFQTAFAGARSPAGPGGPAVAVAELGFGRVVAAASDGGGAADSDLERVVAAVREAARGLGLPPQRSPWLPPLPERVALASLAAEAAPGRAPLGLVDDPARQTQSALVHDLDGDGSLLVYGAGGAGKTTVLRTLAAALAGSVSPARLHVYGLDGGAGGLAALAGLPHCGSVIDVDDAPRVERLFGHLRAEIERRRAASVEAVREAPRIVVLLDGYEGFRAAYERLSFGELVDALPRLVADGRSLGVHFVVTATRRGAVPGGLAGVIPRRLVLRLANAEEYAAAGLSARTRRLDLPPGRGYSPDDLVLQVAHCGDAPDAAAQAAGLAALGADLAARFGEVRAPAIRLLPDAVDLASLPAAAPPLVAIGVKESTLGPVGISLQDASLLVVGPRRGGRTTTLRTLAAGLAATGAELWLLAPRRSALVDGPAWARQAVGVDACAELAGELERRLREKPPERTLVVVVDDGEELVEGPAATALATAVRRSRDLPVRVVAAVERTAAHRAFTGWVRDLRGDEQGVLLDPVIDVDGDLVAARLPRRASVTFPPGRAYLVVRGAVELIQVAR
jgi:S-DNA-T family DNA segregation ATPase FtsK/SpoIIIE